VVAAGVQTMADLEAAALTEELVVVLVDLLKLGILQ
jgi:hypothetical protein